MIVSASRREDIPAFRAKWFIDQIRSGATLYDHKNAVKLSPENVDCFVFWTKNPLPLMPYLHELDDMGYTYYFQFTLTSYGTDIEPAVPSKSAAMIPAMKLLADMIGPERIIWRYDPIIISSKYTVDYHKYYWEKLAVELNDYYKSCTFSFVDTYGFVKSRMDKAGLRAPTLDEKVILLSAADYMARTYGIKMQTCAESIPNAFAISKAHCVDAELISKLTGKDIDATKDSNQRSACGCCKSFDIGDYNQCRHKCIYCYATK